MFYLARSRARRLCWTIACAGFALTLLGVVGIESAGADQSVTSAGPLTQIGITSDLNCSVNHSSDESGEFYLDTACATEIAVDNGDGFNVYGPASIPSGNSPGGFTPVGSQVLSGAGTSANPYKLVSVVNVSTTGLQITETDSYVVGQESYRTDVKVTNTTGSAIGAKLYRGGDCYLQDSDAGYGSAGSPPGAVACVAPNDPENPTGPGDRIEQWLPLPAAGSHYYESTYTNLWARMSSGTDFPDTCDCATFEDNGAGLSWALNIPAHGNITKSHLTTFSPLGDFPLSTAKTADNNSAAAGGQDGYTITFSNQNSSSETLSSITDTLPSGFSYVAGSTTGATTANPSISGSTLTWNGPFSVPAASESSPGTRSLHFLVRVSSTPGTYYNNAGGNAGALTVAPTGNTAPVTVSSVPLTTSIVDTPDPATAGGNVRYTVKVTNTDGEASVPNVSVTDTYPAGTTFVSSTLGCTHTSATRKVTCSLGTIFAGASKSVFVDVKTSSASGGTNITDSATTSPGGSTASATTHVNAPNGTSASGHVEPGGSITTGGTNPATLTLPPSGPGADVVMTLVSPASFCAGTCMGPATFINPIPGYNNPNQPIDLKLTLSHSTLAAAQSDLNTAVVYHRADNGVVTIVPNCSQSGIANPAPCVTRRFITQRPPNWQTTFEVLFLSPGSGWARR